VTRTGGVGGHDRRARFEVIRALGAVADPLAPPGTSLTAALGLPSIEPADHTEVFVLSCPPYASIHLGEEGKLGGEAADRVAGFWRVLGLTPPPEPDHLSVLLALYAELGEAVAGAGHPHVRDQLDRAREALLWEHLWSWAPGYLDAVLDTRVASLGAWATLLAEVLHREARRTTPAPVLPLALRAATRPVTADTTDGLLDSVIAPVRSGTVLTRRALQRAGRSLGVGYRQGERRFTLRSMLEQDPGGTLEWLAGEAAGWAERHRRRAPVGGADPRAWWAGRALSTATTLCRLGGSSGPRDEPGEPIGAACRTSPSRGRR